MATIVTDILCDLTQPVKVQYLHGNLFSQDNAANTINVHVHSAGVPESLGGTISANVIRSDGGTVAVDGSVSGDTATVVLPQACYAVPGVIHIIIKSTVSSVVTTIAAVVANVYTSSTDTVVDPGTIITDVAALIDAIEDAVDSIPVDYSGLLATIAEDYSSSKTYPVVGMYAWQGGVLKRNIVPITTAETYTAAHWTNAVLGDDVSALKSALSYTDALVLDEYMPTNVSRDQNDRIWLEIGYVDWTNGKALPSSSGRYYRSQCGANGAKDFLLIGDGPIIAKLGLDWVSWSCWSYSGPKNADATHSNTGNDFVSGMTEILIPYNDTDKRFSLCFKKNSGTFTSEEVVAIQEAIKFYKAWENTEDPSGCDIVKKYGTFETSTSNGITFTWNGEAWEITGTAESIAIKTILDYRTFLPGGLKPGDKLLTVIECSGGNNSRWRIAFWDKNGNSTFKTGRYTFPVTIPDDACGLSVQIVVSNGEAITTTNVLERYSLVKIPAKAINPKLIVSFVDDDTTSVDYVQKYHDACRHNGIYGNYAAISTKMGGGDSPTEAEINNRNLLLQYEDEGFGVMPHCFEQNHSVYQNWLNASAGNDEEAIAYCRGSLAKTVRQMKSWGFLNTRHWITPYGFHGNGIIRIAKELGMENLVSYNDGTHNTTEDYDRYYIKRVALNKNDTDEQHQDKTMAVVKAAIDNAVAAGSAWIIITTHFNEWGGLSWDSTLDENGYPVGYARFNEVAQYALAAGLTPMTFPAAWENYKSILSANKEIIDELYAT